MRTIYQKYEQAIERIFSALGLALLVYISGLMPLYPAEWRLVVPVAVFIIGCAGVPVAYLLAVTAIAYPLATISIYLAALFLAVAIIPMWYAVHNLWAVLLIAASPLLGGLGLGFVAPLAGGLLMSRREGVISGGGSYLALWMMAALAFPPDTAHMGGPLDALQGRYGGANSFETVGRTFAAFAPQSTTLLNNLLHLAIWAAAGYLCAVAADWGAQRAEQVAGLRLAEKRDLGFALSQIAWHALLPLAVGGLVLTAGLSLVPALLGRPLDNIDANLLNYGAAALLAAAVTLAVWSVLAYLRQPVALTPNPAPDSGRGERYTTADNGRGEIVAQAAEGKAKVERPAIIPSGAVVTVAAATPARPVPERSTRRPDEGERVIMIEID